MERITESKQKPSSRFFFYKGILNLHGETNIFTIAAKGECSVRRVSLLRKLYTINFLRCQSPHIHLNRGVLEILECGVRNLRIVRQPEWFDNLRTSGTNANKRDKNSYEKVSYWEAYLLYRWAGWQENKGPEPQHISHIFFYLKSLFKKR